jgi:hypothetical protein
VPHEECGEDGDDEDYQNLLLHNKEGGNDASGCTTNGFIENILEDSNDDELDDKDVDEDDDDGYSKIKSLIERKQKKQQQQQMNERKQRRSDVGDEDHNISQ